MRMWADLGISVPYGATGEVRTPCPRCSASRHKSRVPCLAVSIEKGIWLCHHCGWKGGLSGRGHGLHTSFAPPSPATPDERKRAVLRRIWGEACPITTGDPVDTYLRQRGIPLPLADMPAVLRYHAHLMYRHEDGQHTYRPAMVARADDADGHAVTLHRTYLAPDGRKAPVPEPKKLLSPAIPGATRGCAIHLYPASETLAIAEGIETALAVRLATGLPVWAAVCARGLAQLVIPDEVHLVVICADHDAAGLVAARTLAQRLLVEQRRVKILTPGTPGTDWADLQEVGHD